MLGGMFAERDVKMVRIGLDQGWRLKSRAKALLGLLNRPQRERLPYFKSGILVIKKIKLTVETGARERFSFSESQGVE